MSKKNYKYGMISYMPLGKVNNALAIRMAVPFREDTEGSFM